MCALFCVMTWFIGCIPIPTNHSIQCIHALHTTYIQNTYNSKITYTSHSLACIYI